jgi:hypothetical protein
VNAAGDLPQVVQRGDQAVGDVSQLNSQLGLRVGDAGLRLAHVERE